MYLCFIDIASFSMIYIEFLNCTHCVVFVFFHLIICFEKKKTFELDQ